MEYKKIFTSNLILFSLFLVSIILRIPSVYQELPPYVFCDESMYLGDTIRMWRSKGLDSLLVNEFRAGPLNSYLPLLMLKGINFFVNITAWGTTETLIAGRMLLCVLINSLAIFFVYGAATTLFGNKVVGLYSAAAFMFSPLVISTSRYWYPDSYVIFFAAGTVFFLSKILINSKIWVNYLFIGIFLALTISVKYSGIFFLFPIGLIFLINLIKIIYSKKYQEIKFFAISALIVLLSFLALLMILNISAFFKWDLFLQAFNWNINNYSPQSNVNTKGIYYYLIVLFILSFGLMGAPVFIFGYLKIILRNPIIMSMVFFPPVLILSYVGGRYGIVVHRNAIIVLPFVLPVFGYGLNELISIVTNRKSCLPIKIVIIAFISGLTLVLSLQSLSSFSHDLRVDSRVLAYKWISENIPSGSMIGTNEFCSGSSPAEQNKNTLVIDPEMRKNLDYYVFNTYWNSVVDPAYKRKGLLEIEEQKYIHFYQFNAINLYFSDADQRTLESIIPQEYQILRVLNSNGPDIVILKRM